MKIGIMGAGAVGAFFGSLLQRAGHDVVFVARGRHLKAMQEKGLFIHTDQEIIKIESEFSGELSDLSEADLILFCVKSMDTEETAHRLLPVLKKDACILTMQNGVDNEEILTAMFGKERVYSSATYVQAALQEPGIVKQIGDFRLVIGELDPSFAYCPTELEKVFNEAGIHTRHSPAIMKNKWKKYIWNVTFNPLSAAVGVSVGEILDNESLRLVAEKICMEVINVAQAQGIQIDKSLRETMFTNASRAKNHKTSMLQDRINGKKMELESICGYIVQKGKELAVPVPTVETVYHVLKYLETVNQKVVSIH